jgi:GTP pyrophosphokinase
MHHIAEYGVAAHWKYKSGEQSKEEIDRKLSWISRLIDTEDNAEDPDEFMHALKIDLFHDETFVFTPKGDVVSLPQGSTLIDFAYSIHSGVGNRMVGAKINGMIAPIDRIPETGDIVEILTSATSKGPSRDWLKIVRTSEARSKIRQWFKKEKRSENIAVGRSEVMKEITRYGNQLTDTEKSEIALNVARRIGMQELDDMYNTIGYGGMALSKIAAKLRDEHDRYVKQLEASRPTVLEASQVKTEVRRHAHTGGIIIDGEAGCAVKFAKCCNPLPGDEVIGFVTKGYGVSVHKRDCPNVLSSMKNEENRSRWKHAEWDMDSDSTAGKAVFESAIQIVAENHITLLAEITTALAEMKVSLLSIHTQKRSETTILIYLTVGCKNIEHFNSILSRLRVIRNVDSVSRAIG